MEKHHIDNNMPSEGTLHNQLQIEWQDHIQTRAQSWKTLQMEIGLILGLVGADLKFNNIWITSVLGILVLFSVLSGFLVSLAHWKVQIRIFKDINAIEQALGLLDPNFLRQGHEPGTWKWTDLINPKPKYSYVPIYILRLHIAFALFTLVYIVAKFVKL